MAEGATVVKSRQILVHENEIPLRVRSVAHRAAMRPAAGVRS